MRRRAMRLTRLVFTYLEHRVAGSVALVGEAFALAREQDVGLNEIDHAVLVYQFAAANRYLATLLCAMNGDLEDLDPDDAFAGVGRVAARHRPKTPVFAEDPRSYLAALASTAGDRTRRVHRFLGRLARDPGSRVLTSLAVATQHFDIALHLLHSTDPDLDVEFALEQYRQAFRTAKHGRDDGQVSV